MSCFVGHPVLKQRITPITVMLYMRYMGLRSLRNIPHTKLLTYCNIGSTPAVYFCII